MYTKNHIGFDFFNFLLNPDSDYSQFSRLTYNSEHNLPPRAVAKSVQQEGFSGDSGAASFAFPKPTSTLFDK